MKTCIVIPARLHSTRLPEKVLQDIHGRPMIQWVYESAIKTENVHRVVIAVDDDRVFEVCKNFGADVLLTSKHHTSGTDRLIEVADKHADFDIYINLQADEPMIRPETLNDLNGFLRQGQAEIATLYEELTDETLLFNFNIVKLVKDHNQKILYFSRNAIPAFRDKPYKDWIKSHQYYRHVGIYGFLKGALKKIAKFKTSNLEKAESLEQLKWMENGMQIHAIKSKFHHIGVDTIEDLELVKKLLK